MRLVAFLFLFYCAFNCLGQEKESSIVLQVTPQAKEAVFFYYSDEFKDVKNYVVKYHPDSATAQTVVIPSTRPLMIRFTRNIQQFPIYVRPGDTIQVTSYGYADNAYTFEGNRQGELNFFTYLEQQQCGIGIPDAFGMDMTTHLNRKAIRFKDLYQQRVTLLAKANDSLHFSPAFFAFAQNEVRNQYMHAMLEPFMLQAVDLAQIPADYIQTVESFYTQGWLHQDEQFYPSYIYANVLGYYSGFLSRESRFTDAYLQARYQNSLQHFTGIARDYMLFSLVKHNIDKGHADFDQYLACFKKDCTYAPYQKYIDSVAVRYNRLTFQPDVIATKLNDATGKQLSWEQLLAQHKGNVIYVDFWASWCSPCIQEMPHATELQKELAGKDVVFVTVSIDAKAAKWKKSMQKLGLQASGKHNYLMKKDSPLGKFLQVPPIPKYVLIDKDGNVFALDAKRPSDKQLVADISQLLERR
jgi:thiol-disulfide isomerase/thioredoxin